MDPTPFERSYLRLAKDAGSSVRTALWIAVILLAGWFTWSLLASVSVYATSDSARLESVDATHTVDSPFVGLVVMTSLRAGRPVRSGEVLVELDASDRHLQVRHALVRAAGFAPQITRLRAQVAAERQASAQQRVSTAASAREAESRIREAEIAAAAARTEASRLRALYADKMVSQRALDVAESELSRLDAAVTTLQAAARRVLNDQTVRERERDVRLQRLEGEMAALSADEQSSLAQAAQLGSEVERRLIRSPASGQIAEAIALQPGAVLEEGQRLGTIVSPNPRLLVAAQFSAPSAFGRVRAGQAAVLRLDGFPWAEFGTVPAVVSSVARETRNGQFRVELALQAGTPGKMVLEHGMPGKVEVLLERVSPLALLRRTAGLWLTDSP